MTGTAAHLGGTPIEPAWPGVRRIAVLRGGGLGDLLFTVPAMQALAAAYPEAELVLLGAPLHAEVLADRPGPVSRVVTLPPAKGVYEDRPPNPHEQEAFFRRMQREPVDLGVQLHGGGRWSNPFLLRLEPRWTVGARTEDAAPLTRWLPYRYYQHEVLRGLEIAGLAGAPPATLEPRITVTGQDLDAADQPLDGLPEPLLAVHPGARDPRRHWPADRFGRIAATCVEQGAGVVVIGSPGERALITAVVGQIRNRLPAAAAGAVRPLADLGLTALCGVLARSSLLLGNDSGPRHLASALGTPTVAIFWMGNVINAGPFGRRRDRVHISWTAACPVCGLDCTGEDAPRCEHDASVVASVPTEPVLADVEDLLRAGTQRM